MILIAACQFKSTTSAGICESNDGYEDATTTYNVDKKWTVVALDFQ